jgi:hypothetical protein
MARPTAVQDKAGSCELDTSQIAAKLICMRSDTAEPTNVAALIKATWPDAVNRKHTAPIFVVRRPPGTDYAYAPIGSLAFEYESDDAAANLDTALAAQIWLKTTATAWVPLDNVGSAIADPGNAGAIPVLRTGYCNIVTAGAETRTVAAPTFRGQRLKLMMLTAGGNGVVTIATLVNQAGNNTLTFGAVADFIVLEAFDIYTSASTTALLWRIALNDGVALSTV